MQVEYYTIRNPYSGELEKRKAVKRKTQESVKRRKRQMMVAGFSIFTSALILCVGFTTVHVTSLTRVKHMSIIQTTLQETDILQEIKKNYLDGLDNINTNIADTVEPVVDQVFEDEESGGVCILPEETQDARYDEAIPLDFECQVALHETCTRCQNVDYRLFLGLIEHESNFNPKVISSAGCYGYCQLNPKYFPSNLSNAGNIIAGIEYLSELITSYNGDISAALRAYNLGHDDGDREYSNTVLSYARDHWGYPG